MMSSGSDGSRAPAPKMADQDTAIPVRRRSRAELYDQDCILGKQSDEHNQRDLHINVIVSTEELRKEERSGESERNRKNDGKRQQIALVLRTQNEVNKCEAKRKNHHCRVA